MKKLIFALIVIAALLVVAMPVAAQGPTPYNPVQSWFNRTSQMSATWAGDPFGGNPRLGIEVKYEPDGKGGVAAKYANATWPYQGIVAKFGPSPYSPQNILPGGIPSSMSGDGSGPRKAIYIGGAWADPSVDPASAYTGYWNLPMRQRNENPYELPACATVKIPAASSRWFKLDTWRSEPGGRVRTQIWLDDELDGATKPSGSAVFGAANKYEWGTAPNDAWQSNIFYGANAMNEDEINGYVMVVYDPDVLQPNYAFAPPNAWIFTLDVSGSGGLRRSCTAAAFAGQPCVTTGKGGGSLDAGASIGSTGWFNMIRNENGTPIDGSAPGYYTDAFGNTWQKVVDMAGTANKGYGAFNKFQPSHLLWYEGNWDGWTFLRVFNQMVWDGTVSVCSYRLISP